MTSTPEKIIEYLKTLEEDQADLEDQVLDIVMFTPSGGISLDQAWGLSLEQRNTIITKINKYRQAQSPNPPPNMM